MRRRLPWPTPARRLAVLTALAGLALALAVLLSTQALELLRDRSAITRRATAARLDEIARTVALRTEYQLLRPLATAVGNAVLTPAVRQGEAVHGPSPSGFARRVGVELAPCRCLASDTLAVRVHVPPGGGRLIATNRVDPGVAALATRLADTLVRQVTLPHHAAANLLGREDDSRADGRGGGGRVVFGLLAMRPPAPGRLFGYIGRLTAAGAVEDIFAVELEPTAFLTQMLDHPVLRPGVDDEASAFRAPPVSIDIADADGRPLLAGGPPRWAPGLRTAVLPPDAGGLALRIYPATEPRPLGGAHGGDPALAAGAGTRLLFVVALFGLTVALWLLAVLQLRSEHALARRRARFVSGVSHELRTPLAQIRLFAELLRDERPTVQARRFDYARIVDEEAQRLTYLVDNVLAFSALEDAAAAPRQRPVSLSDVVADTIERFAPLARSRACSLHSAIRRGVVVWGDEDPLRRIVLNILDNAVKYGPAGQTVHIELSVVGGGAQLTVDDAGPGIPAAERYRIFEPFVRLDNAHTSRSGGSGIGLAIVRDLVTAMRGAVTATESPQRGTRMRVTLPLAPGEMARADEVRGGAPGGAHAEPLSRAAPERDPDVTRGPDLAGTLGPFRRGA